MASDELVVGVLALQGDFLDHICYLEKISSETRYEKQGQPREEMGWVGHFKVMPVRTSSEVNFCDALIIPGARPFDRDLLPSPLVPRLTARLGLNHLMH